MSTTLNHDLKPLGADDLRELADFSGPRCVSLLMPTYRSGRETTQGGARLKNLLNQAAARLGESAEMLKPLDPLTDGEAEFWQHQSDGLAIFLGGDSPKMHRLSHSPDELAAVDSVFFLKPLVGSQVKQTGIVLTLSWEHARLYRVSGESIEELKRDPFPLSFDDLVLPRDPEEQLQFSSQGQGSDRGKGAGATPMYHGHGEGEEKIEADRRSYLKQVSDSLRSALYGTESSLVLLGTQEVIGHFQANSDLEPLAIVGGSPEEFTEAEILQRASEAIVKNKDDRQKQFVERFGTARAQSQTATEIGDAMRAAVAGRIETLWVAEEVTVRGKFDPAKHAVDVTGDEGDSDLVNRTVVEAIRTGADVFGCTADELPENCETLAAILRY